MISKVQEASLSCIFDVETPGGANAAHDCLLGIRISLFK